MPARQTNKPSQPRVAVIGGSLGGLAAANVFVQLGWEVQVFERSQTTFESKGHGLGFVDVALWEDLRGVQMIRRGRQASREQGAFYYGDLWRFLHAGLPEHTLRLGQTVADLGDDSNHPVVANQAYDLCVVADGGWSGLRHYVTGTQPEYAGYIVWRGRVDADQVPGFKSFGVFKNGVYDTIILPLSPDDGRNYIVCGFFVATPEAEISRPDAGTSRHGASDQDDTREQAPDVPTYSLQILGTS
jgi:2-polyprenyl-6-methoxyphenol hydroxylase-like FAD-dependent oxidoreductase